MFRLAIVFLVIALIAAGVADYSWAGAETLIIASSTIAMLALLGGSCTARPFWRRSKATRRRRQRAL